jgi:regulation of enolase protein 1 (concanavalin A-like superfamily)
MKQLFKTTLLAATIAASCGTAVAGNVTVTKQVHSKEGLNGVTANQTSNSIAYVLQAAYREGDKITFTFTDGALVATSFPTVVNIAPVNHATEASAIAGLTLGLLNSDANSVTYRVTKLTLPHNNATPAVDYQNGSTINATLTLGAIQYKAAAIGSGSVAVTVSSQTAVGDILDNAGTRTATVAESKTQFGTAKMTSTFNGVIDVSQARKSFVGTLTDSAAFTITNPSTTGWLNLATVNTSGVTVYGEAGKMATADAKHWSSAGTRTFDKDAAKLAISYTGMVTNDTITYTAPASPNGVVMEAQKFTADMVYNYSSAGKVAGTAPIVTGLTAGEWTLNGATVNIPYMPYGPNASQIMYVSNAGTQAGDILVTVFDDKGNKYDLGALAVKSEPGKVTKLAKAVNDKLVAAGFSGTKASITITVNAPANDITVYASYNVGGSDRGFVNTDQYKGLK